MITKRVVLHFPHNLIDQPVIYKLATEYELVFNILMARITPDEEGVMVLELSGKDSNYAKGVKYLQSKGVKVQLLSLDVKRDDKKCTQCGACVAICPTAALYADRDTMIVNFDISKCIACELCVPACPPRAMIVKL